MQNWIKNKIKKIDARVKEIDYAIYMYGLDAWGHSAFSNIEKMERLRKEKDKLIKRKKLWGIFS